MGEQPNPWDLLQPQDVTSRHRGAKPLRRCELLGVISLLSPEYLLSFERWPFHAEPPDHYAPTFVPARLVGLTVKHPYAIALYARLPTVLRVPLESLRYSFGGDHPSQTTHQTLSSVNRRIRHQINEGWYFKVDSTKPGEAPLHSLPPILHIMYPMSMLSCSEGSRGLSVPLRVNGIFTVTTISPSS